ncbi:MAG: class II aldolase [Oscillospiraceae bacterium]|nr:class II aldolase [Oscillospiraceae bacterium]
MKNFVTMCQKIGSMVDFVQGGGGNASCKHNENTMAIKASGFTIREITEVDGYTNVDYLKVKAYHTEAKPEELETREKESTPFTMSCVTPNPAGKTLRPSVEAGFHSLLKKYVMHTHPVYANVVTCAVGGKDLAHEIFVDTDFVWIPYINPGFSLTLAISDAINAYEKETGRFPKVIFLENHGLVTTSDCAEECTKLHIEVNETIKNYLKLSDFYNDLDLVENGDAFVSSAKFIGSFIGKYGVEEIEKTILYPDQLVYLNGGLKEDKITFADGKMTIRAPKKEAMAILETFAAYAYIIDSLRSSGKTVQPMDQAGTDFINNWESEKYRKSISGQK